MKFAKNIHMVISTAGVAVDAQVKFIINSLLKA